MDAYLKEHYPITSFIFDVANSLKLSPVSTTAACNLYHDFVKTSAKDGNWNTDPYLIAAACLHSASKVMEEPQKIRDVINMSHRVLHPDKPPLEISKTYWNLRDSLVDLELILLRLFAFEVEADPPQRYLVHYIKTLQDGLGEEEMQRSNISQASWNFLMDSCHLPLIHNCSPHLLAIAALYIAVQASGTSIEEHNDKHWWEAMCPEASEEMLQAIGVDLLSLYEYESSTEVT